MNPIRVEVLALAILAAGNVAAAPADFNQTIGPILSAHCATPLVSAQRNTPDQMIGGVFNHMFGVGSSQSTVFVGSSF